MHNSYENLNLDQTKSGTWLEVGSVDSPLSTCTTTLSDFLSVQGAYKGIMKRVRLTQIEIVGMLNMCSKVREIFVKRNVELILVLYFTRAEITISLCFT